MSTVFDIINGRNSAPVPPMNTQNTGFMSQLQQFARTVNNPEQIVRSLIQNGRMSQQQFNQLGQQASHIQQMFGLR